MVQKTAHFSRSTCPLACALDVIGDHWTLLIIRDMLFLERHEYKDMLNAEEGISSNILSDRLKRLEEEGLVSSIPHPQSGRRKLYYLLPKGKDLIHVLIPLAQWSEKHLNDRVDIPRDKKEMLLKQSEKLTQRVLEDLEKWERTNVQKRKKG